MKKFTAFLLTVAMLFTLLLPAQAEEIAPLASSSEDTTVSSVVLPISEKVELTAADEADNYQWQIRVSDDLWVDISGADSSTLQLSYSMVANVLDDGTAMVRCKSTEGETVNYSSETSVTVDYDAVPAFTPAEQPDPSTLVVSEAEVVDNGDADQSEEVPADDKEVSQATPEDAMTEDEASASEPVQAAAPSMMSLAPNAAPTADDGEEPDDDLVLIKIEYIYANGTEAAKTWTAEVAKGSDFMQTVKSPIILGYAPKDSQTEVKLDLKNVEETYTETVVYYPAVVNYTVKHYQQNLDNDEYTLIDTEEKEGFTEDPVDEELAKSYEGFYALPYDDTVKIAADGSTEIEVYYDRYYYLMTFDLDGGYGMEPIYARYGTPIKATDPTKPGYTFAGWDPELPDMVPVNGGNYKANWTVNGNAKVTVIFWGENADDINYSVESSTEVYQTPGTTISFDTLGIPSPMDGKLWTYDHSNEVVVNADGSSILNVYYKRTKFTMSFGKAAEYGRWGQLIEKPVQGYYGSITEKWGADISAKYLEMSAKAGSALWTLDSDGDGPYTSYLQIMPQENRDYYINADTGKKTHTAEYYVENIEGTDYELRQKVQVKSDGDLFITENEDAFPFVGFTFEYFDAVYKKGDWLQPGGYLFDNAKFYYTRNSYKLQFFNNGTMIEEETLKYEEPLKNYNQEPEYPSNLEPEAYVFDGWYTNQSVFDENTRVDFENDTMPANDMILYAHWVPITHNVTFYLDRNSMNKPICDELQVSHGEYIESSLVPTEEQLKQEQNGKYANFNFVGWFYLDANGEEKAFVPESMPVNRDMKLYGKWTSDTLVEYTIHYRLEDGTPIAPDTTGKALAGSTKTFDAKFGNELNAEYQEGYYPLTSSHSLTFDLEDQEYTFLYTKLPEATYTVKYFEKGTNKPLHEEKTAKTTSAVVTEKYEPISGYLPDEYQKSLVLSSEADENVIIFYYVKDENHAPVHIVYYTQNIEGDGYSVYQEKNFSDGEIDQFYKADKIEIPGFTYSNAKASTVAGGAVEVKESENFVSAKVTKEGLEIQLYYDRAKYPFQFNFVDAATELPIANPVTNTTVYQDGKAPYGMQVSANAKNIPGYTCISGNVQSIIIEMENGDTAEKNVATFYYTEADVSIHYQVVGPEGAGQISLASESVATFTGSAQGSTPTANEGYRFVGWYTDEACNTQVDSDWVNSSGHLTPAKNKEYEFETGGSSKGYEEATYYAKFETDEAPLTIKKVVDDSNYDGQLFLFHITGSDVDMYVTVPGNGSVTIDGLKVGQQYTVTEDTSWSWRYSPESGEQKVRLEAKGSEVTFTNTLVNEHWVDSNCSAENQWNGGEVGQVTAKD